MSNKLHELLAVEPDLRGTADSIVANQVSLFTKKQGHFCGKVKTYQPINEDDPREPPEIQHLQTRVEPELQFLREKIVPYWDAVAQKESTNTEAKADVVIDDVVFMENVPVTLLLALEGKLKQLRTVYLAIPTLPPTDKWVRDEQTGTFKTAEKKSLRMKKVLRNHVVHAGTDKHPPQVQTYSEDVPIGEYSVIDERGVLTLEQKSNLLTKIDVLQQAVKKARRRANEAQVKGEKIGDKIFDFIHG